MSTNSETAPREVMIKGTLCLTHSAKSASTLGLEWCTIILTPKGAAFFPVSFSKAESAVFISISHSSKPSDVLSFAINHFVLDTDPELKVISDCCDELGIRSFNCKHWADGGAGATELAEHVAEVAENNSGKIEHLYSDDLSLWEKMR